MRNRTTLDLFLQKVAAGDEQYVERLCRQLADRLLIVPTSKAGTGTPSDLNYTSTNLSVNRAHNEEIVRVYRIKEAHRSVIPVFTAQKRYKTWCEKEGHKHESISLLGADLCLSLGGKAWIAIDPGHENAFELQPALVQRIAEIEGLGDHTAVGTKESAPEIPPDGGPQAVSRQDVKGVESRVGLVSSDLLNYYEKSAPAQTPEQNAANAAAAEVDKKKKVGKFLKFLDPVRKG